MPDRILFRTGWNGRTVAAYVMIFMALAIVALAVWNYNLNSRVGTQEAIRRAENRGAEARRQLGCTFALTIVDVAIDTPVANINDLLAGTTLTPMERADRIQARARYLEKKRNLEPVLKGCVR